MIILGIDSSAVTASAAVVQDGNVLAEAFVHNGLTHSETLAPLVSQVLDEAGISLAQTDALAVANGPGSFTGVRIGVALAKGLAQPSDKPCFGVSSIRAAAYPFLAEERLILGAMDARRQQIYGAFFRGGKNPVRLTPDRALSLAEAQEEIAAQALPLLICGDGAAVSQAYFTQSGLAARFDMVVPPGESVYQRASSVALCAWDDSVAGASPVSPQALTPVYLRPSQAERMLNEK